MNNWLDALGETFHSALRGAEGLSGSAPERTFRKNPLEPSAFIVSRGQLTFDVEGIESPGDRFHSRTAHVPSNRSGVTIGRGFDLGTQNPDLIASFLSRAGFEPEYVSTALQAAGMRGERARNFLRENDLPEISPIQQRNLFELTYDFIERDARRIAAKPDVVTRYGETDWQRLSPAIREVVVDLRYRGDYTPRTREKLQQIVSENNLPDFISAMNDREFWVEEIGVPPQRYQARVEYLQGMEEGLQ